MTDTKQAQHTPGPWTVRKEAGAIADVIGSDGGVVAIPWHGIKGSTVALEANPICEANAAYIVRACNNFEALLKAAKDSLGSVGSTWNYQHSKTEEGKLIYALAKAVEESEGRVAHPQADLVAKVEGRS